MSNKEKFWIFDDSYSCIGFFTQILYVLTPIAFITQLKNRVLHEERVSIFCLLSMYTNAFVYFWTSAYKVEAGADINPMDFCNLAGFYLGLIYLILYIYFVYFKSSKKKFVIFLVLIVVISVSVWLIIKYTVKKDNVADKIFNWIGFVFNVLEYFPIGFSIIYLIKNKISEKFTLFGAFFGLLNATTWLAWAIKSQIGGADLIHSIVANSLGICLTISQFVLFLVFRKKEIEEEDIVNANEEDKVAEIVKEKEEEIKNQPEFMNEFI